MPNIDDIFFMDTIFSIEKQIEENTGIPINNVSHWDSSLSFQKHMAKVLHLPSPSLPWDYYYTSSISEENRKQVLSNLGIQSHYLQSTNGLLLPSSTISIVNMVNLLVHYNYKRLCILHPSYFSITSCCSMFALAYGIEHISFIEGHPKIPVEKIIAGGYDCVWITSPIFCTSYYFDEMQRNDILRLKKAGLTLIFDESLALPGHEMVRYFPINENIFAIYSPHKSISMNGLKFSVIVCSNIYEEFLEQWVDVFSGGLGGSNRDAVLHYLSSNYSQECFPAYINYINKNRDAVNEVVEQFPFASMLPNSKGHYINIFLKLKLRKELHMLMKNVIQHSLASFIPGTLNGFDDINYFCFRVNLTGDNLELPSSVGRILTYFEQQYY